MIRGFQPSSSRLSCARTDSSNPNLDLEVDPKLGWALRHPEAFPIDVNRAPYEMILRVPGIGVKSAALIVNARRFRHLNSSHLSKIGVAMKRAKYFITCGELAAPSIADTSPEYVRRQLTARKNRLDNPLQLSFDFS